MEKEIVGKYVNETGAFWGSPEAIEEPFPFVGSLHLDAATQKAVVSAG